MVARFVLDEIQGFADSADDTRRRRARAAGSSRSRCSNAKACRACSCSTTKWWSTTRSTRSSSRWRAGSNSGCSPTTGRLARNAELQGVPTCNLRRLAQELAPAIVPGDFVRVALTRPGKEDGQGVGHLEDGSMVVVNGGVDLVGGPDVMLQITSVVPTNAGRLLFARLDSLTLESDAVEQYWRSCGPGRSSSRPGAERVSAPRSSSRGSAARASSTARSASRRSRATAWSSCCRPTPSGRRRPAC